MACCSGTNVCSCVVSGDGSTTLVSGFITLPASVLVAATTPYQFAMYAEITV